MVRDTRRSQVVRADRRRGGARAGADGDRSALPDCHRRASAKRCSRSRRPSRRRRPRVQPRIRSSRSSEHGRSATADGSREDIGDGGADRDARSGRARATATTASDGRAAPADGTASPRRAARSASIRRSGSPASRRPSCSSSMGRTRCPWRSRSPGWRRFLAAVPQLHADDPGRRGDRVAGDQGVEHRRAADPDHRAQRRRGPAPGGQGARAR